MRGLSQIMSSKLMKNNRLIPIFHPHTSDPRPGVGIRAARPANFQPEPGSARRDTAQSSWESRARARLARWFPARARRPQLENRAEPDRAPGGSTRMPTPAHTYRGWKLFDQILNL